MRYEEVLPASLLRPYIRRLWALEDATPCEARAVERVVPDGHMEVIVHLGPPFTRLAAPVSQGAQPRALIAGQLHGPLLLQPGRTINLVAISFEPWGARALLGVEPRALTDRLPALGEVLGAGAERLVDALAAQRTVHGRLRAAESWCAGHLAKARLPSPVLRSAVAAALADRRISRVASLAQRVGWGVRRLERGFEEYVGLAPKALLRVGRIQRALADLQAPRPPTLAALAHDHGFVDQAHLPLLYRRVVGIARGRSRGARHALEHLFLSGAG